MIQLRHEAFLFAEHERYILGIEQVIQLIMSYP